MLRIPAPIRAEVTERDQVCRLCGQAVHLICHHVMYGGDAQGMGGRRFHDAANIVLLGQGYEHQCHDRVHKVKGVWQPVMLALIELPRTYTGLQVMRYLRSGADPGDFGLESNPFASYANRV